MVFLNFTLLITQAKKQLRFIIHNTKINPLLFVQSLEKEI